MQLSAKDQQAQRKIMLIEREAHTGKDTPSLGGRINNDSLANNDDLQMEQVLHLVKKNSNINKSRDHLNDGDGIIMKPSSPQPNSMQQQNIFQVTPQPFELAPKNKKCVFTQDQDSDDDNVPSFLSALKPADAHLPGRNSMQQPRRTNSFADIALA